MTIEKVMAGGSAFIECQLRGGGCGRKETPNRHCTKHFYSACFCFALTEYNPAHKLPLLSFHWRDTSDEPEKVFSSGWPYLSPGRGHTRFAACPGMARVFRRLDRAHVG
jgi:hypothetical protein